jgi:hypothetical protein
MRRKWNEDVMVVFRPEKILRVLKSFSVTAAYCVPSSFEILFFPEYLPVSAED